MRIALVHKRYDRFGGAEWDCYELSLRLAKLGHQVEMVAGEFRVPLSKEVVARRVPVVKAGRLAKLLSFAMFAPRVWRSLGVDTTIGFGNTVGEDLYRCSGGLRSVYLRLVAQSSTLLRRARNRLSAAQWATLAIERAKFRPGGHRKILAVSSLTRAEILRSCALPPDSVEVVHYGVDRQRFNPGNRQTMGEGVRRRLGIAAHAPLVLFVGSGFRRKGVDQLLHVWRGGAPAEAALVIAGSDARLRLLSARARAGEFGKVLFTGPMSNVEELYAAADVFVLPSLWEGCPVVMVEALASGVPVVVPAHTGAPELLRGGLADLLLEDAGDPAEVKAKIELALEPGRNRLLRQEARSLAAELDIGRSTQAVEQWCYWAARR